MNTNKKTILTTTIILTIATLIIYTPLTEAITPENNHQKQTLQKLQINNTIEKQIQNYPPSNTNSTNNNILVTPFTGNDRLPSITKDQNDNIIITWTNQQSTNETYMGITYSPNPTDKNSFLDKALILIFVGNNSYTHWDTAYVSGPKSNDFKGLWGVYLDKDKNQLGFYRIPDITTDSQTWNEFYFWDVNAHSPVNTAISDQGFYSVKNHPNINGPFNLYIYHYLGNENDIPQCPVLAITDGALNGGVQYYDAQKNEKTAPSDNPDMWALNNKIHTVVQNIEKNTIIWKKIVPLEEPDYEFTPHQTIIDYGNNPAIAANEENVMITYTKNEQIKAAYSTNDGKTWNFSTVATGNYSEITTDKGLFYVAYIDSGNLYIKYSEDNGISWTEPTQINDINGTVVGESGSLDIHQDSIAWVENRGEDWDIYYDKIPKKPMPIISITEISGGTEITTVLTNTGNAIATNITWEISISGLILFGKEKTGKINQILPNNSITISSEKHLGLGPINIKIQASCEEGEYLNIEHKGIILLFLILINR